MRTIVPVPPPSFALSRLRGRGVVRTDVDGHRPSTPLELFFDLTVVVGVSRAADALHHQLVAGDPVHAVAGFAAAFFGVWWAWMNYTWFASAHDSDDVAHRLLTLLQMAGALVYAAGVARAVDDGSFAVLTVGYVIMRAGLIAGWFRVGRDQPDHRARAYGYVGGLVVLQVLWLARLALPPSLTAVSFAVLGLGELTLPWVVESRSGRVAVFHPAHIEERYGLFTLIVLGESILSASAGFQAALDERGLTAPLLAVGLSGLVVAFAAWWIYFDHPGHLTPTPAQAFRWGYAHLGVFASLAAFGAGVRVAADALGGAGTARAAAVALTVPVAAYLAGLALVMVITGTPVTSARVVPKLAGAGVLLVLGTVLPLAASAVACAATMAALALSMAMSAEPGSAVATRDVGRLTLRAGVVAAQSSVSSHSNRRARAASAWWTRIRHVGTTVMRCS